MPVGIYARALRSFIKNEDHKMVLEFWANNRQSEEDWIVLDNVRNPGQLTACHNVAATFVDGAGLGALTTVARNAGPNVANDPAMHTAIQAVLAGGCVMEVKFASDHSVLLISTVGDPQVELLEGWAGGGAAMGSNPAYAFTSSVYEDYERGRLTKADAAEALTDVANGINLEASVQRLTRCVAGACGIDHVPFKLTLKYKPLGPFGAWSMNTEQAIVQATKTIASHVHEAAKVGQMDYRCTRCFIRKPDRRPMINAMWHDCPTCKLCYCGDCGAAQPRPQGEGLAGTTLLNRHRQCAAGHTMDMF